MSSLYIFLISLVGIADAGYLYYTRISGSSIFCVMTHGCDTVAQSPYSAILGIPLSLLGLLFYTCIAILSFVQYKHLANTYAEIIENVLLFLTTSSVLSSIYFIYLQGWVINAWCIYCLLSACCSCIIFFLTFKKNMYE